MAKQIDKYSDRLCADPTEVDTPNGTINVYTNRTNNILEQFFRKILRGYRRKTGNNSMRWTIQAMLDDTPLVKNLDNQDYMRILLNGKPNLEELFADLGSIPLESMTEMNADADRVLPGYRPLMQIKSLPKQVLHSFSKPSGMAKSN